MPKKALFGIIILIAMSFACGGSPNSNTVVVVNQVATPTLTDLQAVETRTSLISQNQTSFLTPETWQPAPSSCLQSMTAIAGKYSSSGTIITEETWIKIGSPDIWVYHILISNHATEGETFQEYTLIPGTGENRQEFKVAHLNYRGFKSSDNKTFIDIGILSVYSLTKVSTINFYPLGLDKIKSGENLTPSEDLYYTFGYISGNAQFTVSKIWHDFNLPETNYSRLDLRPLDGQTTTNLGTSGGATCDNQGSLVGITAGHHGSFSTEYHISPIPANGIDQTMVGIQQAEVVLKNSGFYPSQ